jgi:hypothetical protein
MANYVTSNLTIAQAKLIGAFQSGELRYKEPRTFLEILNNNRSFYPDYETLRTREDRTLTAYYNKRSQRSLGTGRAAAHTGAKGDTGSLTPSWTTYHDHFSWSIKQANNNVYSIQEMLANEWQNVMANMVEGHETIATAFLFAHRSGVNVAAVEGTFNAGLDTFEIDADANTTFGTYNNRAAQITKIVMDINKWGGNYSVVCDSVSYAKFQAQAAQGSSNATNLSFQFMGVTFIHATELYALAAAIGYTNGYWICIPFGTVGCLPHIPKENKAGVVTNVASYGSIVNPIDGLQYAVHTYDTSKDDGAANGYTQDVLTEVEASIDLAFDHAPLSVSGESSLQAFAIVAST